EEARVAVVPGEAFGAPGYARLSYALGDDDLAGGVTRNATLLGGGAPAALGLPGRQVRLRHGHGRGRLVPVDQGQDQGPRSLRGCGPEPELGDMQLASAAGGHARLLVGRPGVVGNLP